MPKITSHKGGRTEQIRARLTPEDKQALESLASTHNVSMADIITGCIKAMNNFNPLIQKAMIHGYEIFDRDDYTIVIIEGIEYSVETTTGQHDKFNDESIMIEDLLAWAMLAPREENEG